MSVLVCFNLLFREKKTFVLDEYIYIYPICLHVLFLHICSWCMWHTGNIFWLISRPRILSMIAIAEHNIPLGVVMLSSVRFLCKCCSWCICYLGLTWLTGFDIMLGVRWSSICVIPLCCSWFISQVLALTWPTGFNVTCRSCDSHFITYYAFGS